MPATNFVEPQVGQGQQTYVFISEKKNFKESLTSKLTRVAGLRIASHEPLPRVSN